MPFPWRRAPAPVGATFEARDGETEWVLIDGRRVGYLYRMWRHCVVCTATRSAVFIDEAAALRWLAEQEVSDMSGGLQ